MDTVGWSATLRLLVDLLGEDLEAYRRQNVIADDALSCLIHRFQPAVQLLRPRELLEIQGPPWPA